jgi:hypothetical protein
MESEESKVTPVTEVATEAAPEANAGTVTVTAKEDCNLYAGGTSVALTKGQEVEMTPEEAAAYANLGLVEGGAAPRGLPRRR